jgi:hypothetical protein
MLKRWHLYLRETVRPAVLGGIVLLVVVGETFMFRLLTGGRDLVLSASLVPAAAVYFLLALYWRISDEFKDYETDLRFFPDRPVPSGRVTLSDLEVLRWLVSFSLFAVAVLCRLPLTPLALIFAYEVLQGRWFFLKDLISNNRLIAFATHAPSALLFNYYVIIVCGKLLRVQTARWETIFVAFWFSLPFFAHEFSRKIRAPSEEQEGYQTYSALLGYKRAARLPALSILLHWLLLACVSGRLNLSTPLLAVTGVAAAAAVLVLAASVLRPEGLARFARPVCELYLLVALAAVPLDMALSHPLIWEGTIRLSGT